MTIILGTAEQGPVDQAVGYGGWDVFTNRTYARVDLSNDGLYTLPVGTLDYRFVSYNRVNYWETAPKLTGGTNEYRLRGFPLLAGSFTIQQADLNLTREYTGTPGAGEFFLDEPSGLLRLGAADTDIIVRYTGTTGAVKSVDPFNETILNNVVSWGASGYSDETWIECIPEPKEESLVTCAERGDFGVDTYMLRCDTGTAALCTISASSVGTLVLKSELGTNGNQWRACWDNDAVYILRPPSYPVQRITIPLTTDASVALRRTAVPTAEEMLLQYAPVISIADGDYVLTGSTIATFTGGSIASPDWNTSLRYIGMETDALIAPLGLTSATVADIFLEEAVRYGVWPVVLLGTETEVVGNHQNLAITCGVATYSDGYSSSPLHGLVASLSSGAPYYLPSVSNFAPGSTSPALIYPVESIRHGWMVSRVPMVSGDLYLNHHLWVQGLVSGLRAILDKYIGRMGATAGEVGTDPLLVQLMSKYKAEYRVTAAPGEITVGVKVTPPGMVSEVRLDVRRTA